MGTKKLNGLWPTVNIKPTPESRASKPQLPFDVYTHNNEGIDIIEFRINMYI